MAEKEAASTAPARAPRGLGTLEAQLMDALWASTAELSVQEVSTALGPGHNYKTVMTVLNRLVEKQLLARQLDGRAFRYRPTDTRESFLRTVADELVHGYVESYGSGSAAHLARAVDTVAPRPAPVAPAASLLPPPLTIVEEPRQSPVAKLLAIAMVLEAFVFLIRGRKR
jgi:predicted transcriptional regulator